MAGGQAATPLRKNRLEVTVLLRFLDNHAHGFEHRNFAPVLPRRPTIRTNSHVAHHVTVVRGGFIDAPAIGVDAVHQHFNGTIANGLFRPFIQQLVKRVGRTLASLIDGHDRAGLRNGRLRGQNLPAGGQLGGRRVRGLGG